MVLMAGIGWFCIVSTGGIAGTVSSMQQISHSQMNWLETTYWLCKDKFINF
jgi:hypothetical protein